jgi:hypothetical protein
MGVVPMSGYGGVLWAVRRCAAWGPAADTDEAEANTPPQPMIVVDQKPLEVMSYSGVDAQTESSCRATIRALCEQAMGLNTEASIAALQDIEGVGACTGPSQLEALGKIAEKYGLAMPGR